MTTLWIREIPKKLKRIWLLSAWLGGLVLIGGLLGFLTRPVRDQALARSVNRFLEAGGQTVRLGGAFSPWEIPGQAARLGRWFKLEKQGGGGVIFSIMNYGTQTPFLALVSPQGRVEAVIPLGNNAVKTAARLPQEIRLLYARRVEESAVSLNRKLEAP